MADKSKRQAHPWVLVFSLLISLGVGALSGALSMNAMRDYRNFAQPPLSPPGWLFPVVWTALFLLMGISAWRVWKSESERRTAALVLYAVQLAVNFVWPLIFFNAQAYWPALAVLAVLWALVLAMVIVFARIDRPAGRMQIPYLLWLSFAMYLNIGVAMLN